MKTLKFAFPAPATGIDFLHAAVNVQKMAANHSGTLVVFCAPKFGEKLGLGDNGGAIYEFLTDAYANAFLAEARHTPFAIREWKILDEAENE